MAVTITGGRPSYSLDGKLGRDWLGGQTCCKERQRLDVRVRLSGGGLFRISADDCRAGHDNQGQSEQSACYIENSSNATTLSGVTAAQIDSQMNQPDGGIGPYEHRKSGRSDPYHHRQYRRHHERRQRFD